MHARVRAGVCVLEKAKQSSAFARILGFIHFAHGRRSRQPYGTLSTSDERRAHTAEGQVRVSASRATSPRSHPTAESNI